MRGSGNFEEAWRCLGEAMTAVETTKESWCEADFHRVAGEIARMSQGRMRRKLKGISSAHSPWLEQQQAKSWELRAAMSLARLWCDQGKVIKRANCLLRSTGGSLRGLTRAI